MIRRICSAGVVLVLLGSGVALSGCGAGSSRSSRSSSSFGHAASSHTMTLPSGQALVEAADRTDQASGYRMSAQVTVTVGSVPVSIGMHGVIEQHGTVGAITTEEALGGQKLDLQIRIDHQMFYMTGPPALTRAAHGKHWLSFNLADAQRAQGLGGLQSAVSSNPSQFLTYLRAVGSQVTRVGTQTIGGDATTEYRATIDLDRYTKLVAPARRAAARATIARLESEIGGHTLPITAWIDGHHDIRRMHLQVPTCVQGHRLSMAITMNLFDYGHVPQVTIPPASETDNITSKLASELPSHQTSSAACPASSA